MQISSLNGSWTLHRIDHPADLIPAQVPGCVHLDLLAAERIPDPYYRDNELQLQWISDVDWVYSRAFDVSPDLLAHDRVLLRCQGLDTLATITLNGVEIAKTDNMYRTYEFDVKPHLTAGENTIRIQFGAPVPFVEKMDKERGELAAWVRPMRINSGAWIRKEPCNFGWDWGPVLVTSGIWRDIDLVAFNTARITDLHILQDHSIPGAVTLDVKGTVEVVRDAELAASISVEYKGTAITSAYTIPVNNGVFEAKMLITDPALWWVNGLGDQPLYNVTADVCAGERTLDTTARQIGLRVLKLERNRDKTGESLTFSCNGVPFFAKGANWIPADPFAARVSNQMISRLISDAQYVHMNMLRVWGGGIYESDTFYEQCDFFGIAVWQDFMFACGTYPSYDDAFMANVRAEAEDNIRRLRHHPSIALWCGNNEIEAGMLSSKWNQTLGWENYGKLFDQLLPQVVAELDPQTAYWPGSPHTPVGNREDHNNPDSGDSHLWDVWHGKKPFEWYHTRPDRFVSEFGFQSFPVPETIEAFTLPEDRNITSYVMEHHQRSPIGNATIITYMLDWFRVPNSFESSVWLSQILQGLAMQYAIEGWRRNMPRTMGALYWQLNDCWPGPTWSSIDYKGNWKATQFMAKRFFSPLLISGVEDIEKGTVAVHVTSDRLEPVEAVYHWRVTTPQGDTLRSGDAPITVAPNASHQVATLDFSDLIAEHTTRGLLIWLELIVDEQIVSDNLVTFSRPKHIELPKPTITFEVEDIGNEYHSYLNFTVQSDAPALFVWLELDGMMDSFKQTGVADNFEDNFFHLTPGRPYTVDLSVPRKVDLDWVRANLRIKSLVDTY